MSRLRRFLASLQGAPAMAAAQKAADTRALQILQRLDIGLDFVPWTRSAMRPSTVVHILNDIAINRRTAILELGAGISTLYLAWAARRHGASLLSIEEDEGWAGQVASYLTTAGLAANARLLVCPRLVTTGGSSVGRWYDPQLVKQALGDQRFDLVVIDGPAAFRPGDGQARGPALDLLHDHLAERCALFLDDAVRPGERQIVAEWARQLQVTALVDEIEGGHAYFARGQRFFSAN